MSAGKVAISNFDNLLKIDQAPPKRRASFARRRKLVANGVVPDTSSPVVSAIGVQIRKLRHNLGLTGPDLAAQAKISVGMLSRIEKGDVEASIKSLESLARALNVPITRFFDGLENRRHCEYIRAGDRIILERQLKEYLCQRLGGVIFDSYRAEFRLIRITERGTNFRLSRRRGVNFMFVLAGSFLYRCGDKDYSMTQGDSLLFDLASSHGFLEVTTLPVTCLSLFASPRN